MTGSIRLGAVTSLAGVLAVIAIVAWPDPSAARGRDTSTRTAARSARPSSATRPSVDRSGRTSTRPTRGAPPRNTGGSPGTGGGSSGTPSSGGSSGGTGGTPAPGAAVVVATVEGLGDVSAIAAEVAQPCNAPGRCVAALGVDSGLVIVDYVQGSARPKPVRVPLSGTVVAVTLRDPMVYAVERYAGGARLRVIDLTDPSAPRLGSWTSSLPGVSGRGIAVSANALYVGAEKGFEVYGLTNPQAPQYLRSFAGPGAVKDVVVGRSSAGEPYAAVLDTEGYSIFDVRTPSSPVQVKRIGAGIYDLAAHGSALHTTTGRLITTLQVETLSPIRLGFDNFPLAVSAIEAGAGELFAGLLDGVSIYRVLAGQTKASFLQKVQTGTSIRRLAESGGLLFASGSAGLLAIIDPP